MISQKLVIMNNLLSANFYFDVMIDGNKIIKNITYHFCMISGWNLVYFEIQRI